jgi:hypothetical protein
MITWNLVSIDSILSTEYLPGLMDISKFRIELYDRGHIPPLVILRDFSIYEELQESGIIAAEEGETEGRQRTFYRLTENGEMLLEALGV